MDRGEIARDGYTVDQAANGGWVLISNAGRHECRTILGAFDNHKSLLAFLTDEHEAHANRAGTDRSA